MNAAERRRGWTPALIATTAIAVAILLVLGSWQLQRLAWKQQLMARVEAQMAAEPAPLPAGADPAAWEWRRVSLTGEWLPAQTRLLQAQVLRDPMKAERVGTHALTPFQPEGGGPAVLVDRGFLPARLGASDLPPLPPGTVTVTGVARAAPGQGWSPDNDPAADAWYFIDLDALAAAFGLPALAPVFVAADAGPDGQFPVGGQAQPQFSNNHLGYAVFWYSMAAVAILFAWRLAAAPVTSRSQATRSQAARS